ncbi:MAG: transposase [Deltaproteobacteria bacterium]|nr:transposase [Deltaproteobacteria bacterium]
MARKPRIHYPSAYYHVILRGNARQDIFSDDTDRYRFYLLLQEGAERFGHRIHAFCLMTNHVHLVVQVADKPLSKIMQNLSFRYTRWVNWRQNRSGHLFQGRYKSVVVDGDEYLLELVRYTHLNPVRAGIAETASAYRWSSHAAYCGNETIPWLTTEFVLAGFSPKLAAACKRYAAFVSEGEGEGHRPEFHGRGSDDTRVLGDSSFVERVLSEAEEIPLQSRMTPVCLAQIVAAYYRLPDLHGRSHRHAEARAVCAWVAQETGICTLTEVARIFHRDISTVSAGARRIGVHQDSVQVRGDVLEAVRKYAKTKA